MTQVSQAKMKELKQEIENKNGSELRDFKQKITRSTLESRQKTELLKIIDSKEEKRIQRQKLISENIIIEKDILSSFS